MNARPEINERVAILETRSDGLESSLKELTDAVKTANESVRGLTNRLDKAQSMLVGAGVVFTTVGGLIVWIVSSVTKFFAGTVH